MLDYFCLGFVVFCCLWVWLVVCLVFGGFRIVICLSFARVGLSCCMLCNFLVCGLWLFVFVSFVDDGVFGDGLFAYLFVNEGLVYDVLLVFLIVGLC